MVLIRLPMEELAAALAGLGGVTVDVVAPGSVT
jgi:hypothetical protein